MSESEKNKLLTTTTKVFAVITLVSGVYGVSYQKGMIMGMGMGNLNGNYDIREIFNSAVFGYIDLFSKAIEINVFDIALANSPFTYVISANGSQPGPQMRQVVQGSALDAENNRLLVLDGDNQLIAVDLEAGDRELLAEDVGGLSSLWDLAKNIEYDPTERLLYIADSTLRGGLYVVDPVSGSSVLLSN